MGSDRLERLSSSGFDGPAHSAHGPGAHHTGRDAFDQHLQQQQALQAQPPPGQHHQQQGAGGVGSPYGRSPREGGFGRASKPSVHHVHAPDSPEEGEALPSPPGPAIRKQLAAAAAAQAAATGSAGAGVAAGAGGAGAGHFAEPSSSGAKQQPSPRVAGVGLERAAFGAMHGVPGGGGGSGGAHRAAAAGHADMGEDPEGGRGAAHGGAGGMMPAGLSRSSSGGSTSGLHALTSPAGGVQRLPRESPRGLQTTPSDPLAGRRGAGAAGAGGYRAAGGPAYRESGTPGMPRSAGTAGGSFGSGSRGREDGSQLPTPWQTDRRRSSVEGWDRFGHGQDGGSGATGPGPGAGKPWGRQGGRGRGAGGGWA